MANYEIMSHRVLDSTNAEAKRVVESGGEYHKSVIVAEAQSQGRGRYGREWVSESGNLFLSIILRKEFETQAAQQLSFVAALAVVGAISAKNTKLKWPNDILLNDKKISGILLEAVNHHNELQAVIIGIGVNVKTSPSKALFAATSLSDEGLEDVDKDELLGAILSNFDDLYNIWLEKGFPEIRKLWLEKALDIGTRVESKTSKESLAGCYQGINEEGSLILKLDNGDMRYIKAGDVFLL